MRKTAVTGKRQPWGVLVVCVVACAAHSASAAEPDGPDHLHDPLPVHESVSLEGAVDAALALYPSLVELEARKGQAAAWSDRGQSWLADRPSIMLRYQTDRWGPDNGLDEYEAGLLLPLWSWGGRSAVQNLGDTLSTESGAAGLLLRWEVAGHMRIALWDIAIAENDHELAEQALQTATRLTASVERRYELGDVALSDVLLAQSSLLESQTELIETEAGLLDAERAYRSRTGLEWRPPFAGETLSESHDISPEHPALAFANAEVGRAEAMLAVAESTAKSGMSVLIGPRRERPAYGDELDSSVGIVVNIPFGGTSKTRTEISSAARVLARARSARNLELRNLSLALHEAVHGLNVVRQNLAAASHRLELAERQQTMWESAYEKGELELIDLLRMQASAIAAKRQVMRLKIDEKRQTALYNQAVGNTP